MPRVALGEDEAFKECVARYGSFVYSIARRYLNDERDVEDACQEIFVALWRSAGAFEESRGNEATFVAVVARRRLIDRQRTSASRPLPRIEAEVEASASALETHVDARRAMAALSECNEAQKRVILLSALQGFTHEEISKELSLPLGTVKSHYTRGLDRVKRALTRRETKT